jgi:hypothetical protein
MDNHLKNHRYSDRRFYRWAWLFTLVLTTMSCTVSKRYHFRGFNIYGKYVIADPVKTRSPKQLTDNGLLGHSNRGQFSGQIITQASIISVNSGFQFNEGGGVFFTNGMKYTDVWDKLDFSIRNAMNKKANNTINAIPFNTVTKEDVGCALIVAQQAPKSVTYIDTSDPEIWAILFFSVGLTACLVALFLPMKIWTGIALIFLSLGVICAALCEGDFYFASTKILAFIGALVLVVWGGASASIFDL